MYPINWFFEDCRTRHRTPEDVEKRAVLVSEVDLKKMREDVHWQIRNALQLKEVSSEAYGKPDPDGVGVSVRLHVSEANGDQLEKTLVDLAVIDAAMGTKS